MTANIDAMLRAGVEAYRAGNNLEARAMLEKVLELDEYNEMAWLWLSAVVETPEEKRTCLENVLVINPNNENAKKGLRSLGMDSTPPPPPIAKTGTGPFTSSGFVDDLEDEPPTATSSASSSRSPKERSGDDYDQWITGLGIGSSAKPEPEPVIPDEPFGRDMFSNRLDDLFDEDDFDSSLSSAAPPIARKSQPTADDDYDYGDSFAPDDAEVDFETAVNQDINQAEGMELFNTDIFDDAEDEDTEPDPTEFFKLIPKEIKPTRLPGESESYPAPLIAGIVVLIVLNIGALIFLMTQLG